MPAVLRVDLKTPCDTSWSQGPDAPVCDPHLSVIIQLAPITVSSVLEYLLWRGQSGSSWNQPQWVCGDWNPVLTRTLESSAGDCTFIRPWATAKDVEWDIEQTQLLQIDFAGSTLSRVTPYPASNYDLWREAHPTALVNCLQSCLSLQLQPRHIGP